MTSGWKYVTKQLVLILVIALLCCLFLAIGLMIGYGIIGEGKNLFAILSLDKWQSIIGKFTGN
ncbi:DNA-directed RNA polymerase subunit beta [Streptococcus gallolyticus]|jgi:hypothetical protein